MQYNIAHSTQTIENYAEESAGLSFMRAKFCLDPATVTGNSSSVVICLVSHSQRDHIKETALETFML